MKKIILLALLVGLAGCGKSEAEKAKYDAEMKEIRYNRMAKEFVQASLKDSDSAKFRNQKGFCGEVNAKNGFGAYTGFKRFVAADQNMIVMEGDLPSQDFQKIWESICN
ncbi:hypothetical protein [Acinetobacter sp. YH12100]|uniref:hypothetical protein n=1 Tax=Acinetobacter sp. YH12100 TaxID=2601089 RepID=UPI0015D2B91F|nr:hypothetical protein [Acinetobacter sp. YH12100]